MGFNYDKKLEEIDEMLKGMSDDDFFGMLTEIGFDHTNENKYFKKNEQEFSMTTRVEIIHHVENSQPKYHIRLNENYDQYISPKISTYNKNIPKMTTNFKIKTVMSEEQAIELKMDNFSNQFSIDNNILEEGAKNKVSANDAA